MADAPEHDVYDEFDEFVRDAQVRLRRALIGAVGLDRVDDAVAEALAWAVEHRDQLVAMATSAEDALDLARSVEFVDEATFRERYDVGPDDMPLP